MSSPLFVYGNWSAYDELSDGIELTEKLAMRQFSHLLRLRDQGVRFNAYLMDAFWYAPDGGYRDWRRPHWPDGPDRWLLACQESGLLPGLWFTVNTLCHLDAAPAWEDSVDEKRWGMSLCQGGFLEDFARVLEHWYERGVRLFKFDFAEFDAAPANMLPAFPREVRQRNVEAFSGMLKRFRARRPDVVLMAFNGFDTAGSMERTDRIPKRCIDTRWLHVFDSLYCGDPRPSDAPDVDFWRSVDLYSDHMVRVWENSGIPLSRIDNCAFMAGPTGTCYWRGKAGWKRSLLLSLARGGRIHVAYGDLSQFSDDDAHWWAAAQALYAPSMVSQKTWHLGGVPGESQPYGWVSARDAPAIVTLVNPGPLSDHVHLLDALTEWHLIAYEPGFEPEIGENDVLLGPGQLALLAREAIEPGFSLAAESAPRSYAVIEPATRAGSSFSFDAFEAEHACLIVEQKDETGKVVRPFPSECADWLFRAEFFLEGAPVETQSFPPRRVWSGMSWACFPLPSAVLGRPFRVVVESREAPQAVLEAHVRLTTAPAVVGTSPE